MAAPSRTCIGCRAVHPTAQLTRVSRGANGWVIGPGEGRGAWICRAQPTCLDEALGRGRLGRAVRSEVSAGDLGSVARLVRTHWMEDPGPEPLG
ncbi:MAG: YlxR family protein [Actinomycetia bacterium]|nr:YlxR family protein [Actinomycetes bacterium]MCP3909366.1 YlxR family protein [Actinomycetes bacterium]MCP4087625.1 YlxR family protein [Actinomycetes bacterium]